MNRRFRRLTQIFPALICVNLRFYFFDILLFLWLSVRIRVLFFLSCLE